MKRILSIFFTTLLVFSLIACENNEANNFALQVITDENPQAAGGNETSNPIEEKVIHPIATLEIENMGTITLELYPELAPNTVNNFIALANDGFYDGLTFHRVISGFMIQGGDPLANGAGGPGYAIDGEFSSDEGVFKKYLSHERGVISMARAKDPNSAGSQFFIVQEDTPELDLQYASFGRVIDGMSVVDDIASCETGEADNPLETIVIKRLHVELNGYEAEPPITH